MCICFYILIMDHVIVLCMLAVYCVLDFVNDMKTLDSLLTMVFYSG